MDDLLVHSPVFLIEIEKIVPNPYQPRRDFDEQGIRELAQSINEVGLLQPVVVTKIERETSMGTEVSYQLIAGERRLRASKMLNMERIPAIIKRVDLEREHLELAIVENIQRSDLNPIESARAFAKFQDEFNLTQREIAGRLGKSREAIANTLRLLNLPSHIQDAIADGRINESQGRLLLTVSDLAHQHELFEDILRNNLSVRGLKSKIDKAKKPQISDGEEPLTSRIDPQAMQIEKDLEILLGTKVKVEKSGASGKITISFFSSEELQGIIEKISTSKETDSSPPEFPTTF